MQAPIPLQPIINHVHIEHSFYEISVVLKEFTLTFDGLFV
jgi:hypothetical protein